MKLDIYMKSGNVIHLRGVKTYEFKNRDAEGIVSLSLSQRVGPWGGILLVKAMVLSQIEAVVVRRGLF
jgi:hypothetical protein